MAQKPTTSGAQTAGVLLKTVPKEQQLAIARGLIVNLTSEFDVAAASVAVELVADGSDSTLRNDLLDVLKSRIEHGSPDQVVSLLAGSPELLDRLVKLAGQHLDHSTTASTAVDSIDVASETTEPDEQTGLGRVEPDGQDAISSTLLQWLRFTKIAISSGHPLQEGDEKYLFTSALKSLNNTNRPAALAARDVVFLLISSAAAQQNLEVVQTTIASLITARDAKLQQTLGYALWMRLLAASDGIDLSRLDLSDDSYWEPLLSGLRNGDAERRKMSLDILKQSVALAIEQGQIRAVARIESASPRTTSYQYSRYCAVFETLVLARYTNLVVECERDLNLLSSGDSVIQSRWLYVLLSTALDVKTTDQTRKFIGDWILRSDLFSSRFPEGLAHFVSHSLLPWAMEGHLFIGSTRLHDGQNLSSLHGDRLSTSVCNLLVQTASDKQPEVLDAILEFLVRKHATLFAYSAVHLVRGISRAFETSNTLSLTKQQVEHLLFISALRTLPEVASDYLIVQCSMICDLSESRTKNSLLSKLSEIGQNRFRDLKTASDFVKQNVRGQAERIDSPTKSQRDIKILASVEKCRTTLQKMAAEEAMSSDQLQNVLEDIWSDVEFLEYPRALLVKLPAVFFSTAIYKIAYQDTNEEDSGLRDLLVATLPRLLDLTHRRSFLLAPLVGSLRELVLSAPESASILDLEGCILRICQSPPEPNIDLRMEYSTIPLLSDLLEESTNTCRDHYFGQGEGYGFAAYLDLISRMGSQHPELIQSLLVNLLARWRKQKVPTPTISAWKTTLQLEVMLLCFEQRSSEVDKATLDPMLKDLYFILSIEPLPRYRYLIEWAIARIQIRHPELRAQTLDMLSTKDHQSNPKFLASLMKLGVMIATAPSGTQDFARSLATIFIALSSSSKIIIRHEAQWAFPQLMDHARAQNWEAVLANPAHVSLDDYIRSLPRFGDPPAERVMSKLDPLADHTLTNLVEGLWTDLDYTRPPYTTHQDFVDLYANDAKRSTQPQPPAPCMPLGPAIPKPPRPSTTTNTNTTDSALTTPQTTPQQDHQDPTIALQTKGTAYMTHPTSLSSSQDPHQPPHRKTHPLLLLASLIENPHNLGGLSRASEIFGARALYVSDPARSLAHKDFTSVAVSSHNHVKILPLPVAGMVDWMAGKKREGWTVVGVEQTDRSVLLGRGGPGGMLPRKTVLVLGSEREGMPARVLAECDVLVEIPQVGVTRSLNVQTAAAVVLFEYGRQYGEVGVEVEGEVE